MFYDPHPGRNRWQRKACFSQGMVGHLYSTLVAGPESAWLTRLFFLTYYTRAGLFSFVHIVLPLFMNNNIGAQALYFEIKVTKENRI